MKCWIATAVMWTGSAWMAFAQATVCVGIGAARIPTDELPWESRTCLPARTDAEQAFRELVPDAARERHLYSQPMRWDGPAVLLSDGVTDNRSIPVTTRILRECAELSSVTDGLVVWLAGIGEIAGADSWVYDRMGDTLRLSSVMSELSETPRSQVLVRAYPERGGGPAHTLYVCDERRAAALREWAIAGKPARGLFPGLSWLLETATPIRLDRVRDRLKETGERVGGRVWLDLGHSLERTEQRITQGVEMRELPVFRTRRRPGPFFTIVEEETDEVIGTKIQINSPRLGKELRERRMATPAVNRVVERVEAGVAAAFQETFAVGANSYTLSYDREAREVEIRYLD